MNTAQYTSQLSYPLSTEGLDFIQNQILCLEQMAAALGNGNWILSGMKDIGGTLTAGVVAIVTDGVAEIVNYPGGDSSSALNGKWKIVTTVNSSPARTVKTLVYDNTNGTITGLTRADIKTINSSITQITKNHNTLQSAFNSFQNLFVADEWKWTGSDSQYITARYIRFDAFKIVSISFFLRKINDNLPTIPADYRPKGVNNVRIAFNCSAGNGDTHEVVLTSAGRFSCLTGNLDDYYGGTFTFINNG